MGFLFAIGLIAEVKAKAKYQLFFFGQFLNQLDNIKFELQPIYKCSLSIFN